MASMLAGFIIAVPLAVLSVGSASGQNQPGLNCNLFGPRHTCAPYLLTPPGQDLRLMVRSRRPHGPDRPDAARADERIDNIRQLFAALRHCWSPPPRELAREGMELSVRLSFNKFGSIIGEPRLTYASRAATAQQRDRYRQAVTDSLSRCTPLPFTAGMGGAVAGRPLMIRYIDDRKIRKIGV